MAGAWNPDEANTKFRMSRHSGQRPHRDKYSSEKPDGVA
jgi:hypothetical protein